MMRKRIAALLLTLALVLSALPAVVFAAEPVVDYVTDSTVYTESGAVSGKYANVVKNWGTRGEPATYLSPMAEEFYDGLTYSTLEDYSYAQMQALMADNHTTFTK